MLLHTYFYFTHGRFIIYLPRFKIEEKGWMYHVALCGEMNLDLGDGTKGDAIVQTGGDNGTKEIHVIGTEIQHRYGGG